MFKCLADEDESYRWGRVARCVLAAVITVLIVAACGAPSAEEVTAESERVAYDKKITFTMPLEYTATVSQCSTKDGCKTRYYHPRGK